MKRNINQKVGLLIKVERTKRELTQEVLAEMSDLSTKALGAIERGQSSPTLETLEKIANALGMELPKLVDVKDLDL